MDPGAQCVAHLDAGGIVLTADLRQARILRRLHDRAQLAAGREAWPSAQVLPLDAWLGRLWSEAGSERHALPRALAPVALRWMWRRLAGADTPGLLDPAELGARARLSWLALRAHGGAVAELPRWPLTRDQQAFVAWAGGAERELARLNACDGAELARHVVDHDAIPPAEAALLLVGFRRPTPAESALFEALQRGGWKLEHLEPAQGRGQAWQHVATDPGSEQATAIAWLRARLAERPDGVHGLMVPELASCRGALERALESALQPELELPGGPRERVFDIGGGPALEARAVIAIAIDAVCYAFGQGDWTQATRLLRSAFVPGDAPEREVRARLDVAMRSNGRAHPGNPEELARAARGAGAPGFASALDAAAARASGPARRNARSWAQAFGTCLSAWGWPGTLALDSSDWQAASRFSELLHGFAALDEVATAFTAGQALSQLRELGATPFQPESGEPAVFVFDAWTDPGVGLDSLWVANLTATRWPRPVRIDPFLPIEAQRRLGLPRATPDSSVTEAVETQAAWLAQARALVLSWPQNEDDTEVDGSAIVPAGFLRLPPPPAFDSRANLQHHAAMLEPVADDAGPPVATPRVPAGARVLELQSRCPFRAFGELRLHAQPLEQPRAGFDRRLRGQVLHRALEHFWSGLGTQAALLALDPAACLARVRAVVDRALGALAPATIGPRALGLEREWQCLAIERLLAVERVRAPFAVVETERELTGRIGGLELRLRVDRMDEAGGALVVIDYKSGRSRGAPWRGARMDAPQLPLYAVLHPGRPAAIALAEAGAAARFVGVGDPEVAIDGIVAAPDFPLTEDKEKGFDWRVVTERWWAWLDALARDHAEGRATVDPKLAADTCRRCHLGTLCRVEPAGALEDEMAGADDDA